MWLIGALAVLCAVTGAVSAEWRCPELSRRPAAECSCDLPFTIRCAGDHTALQIIGRHLREAKIKNNDTTISLLDMSLRGVTALSTASVSELSQLDLQGLVISSGNIRRVQQNAFKSVASTVVALGLPNNKLPSVPTEALNDLKILDRLDLSNNKIVTLKPKTFEGLENLLFLDISDNLIRTIASGTFDHLNKLTVLRLRGNLLTVFALSSFKNMPTLQCLDLSANALSGPIGPTTFPALNNLTTLQIADNTFHSIKQECLSGSPNLIHLDLHNNQVDVLEDFAFKRLVNLTLLDLSQNDIVAVSGSSLAQLNNLEHLDLSHNYLRSLSAEPFKSLSRLNELLLHDNDISIIEDGALAQHKSLVRLTVADNPLNCDCLMAGFARWLREAGNLARSDKEVATCATPPHLEGALLYRLSKNKLCDDFEHIELEDDLKTIDTKNYNDRYEESEIHNNSPFFDDLLYGGGGSVDFPDTDSDDYTSKFDLGDNHNVKGTTDVTTEEDMPVSNMTVHLTDAWYEGEEVHLNWSLQSPSNLTHKCAGVSVSRADETAKHVACHDAAPSDVILRGLKIDPAEFYVFCIALEQTDSKNNPVALVLGCGKSIRVRQKATFATIVPTEANTKTSTVKLRPIKSSVSNYNTIISTSNDNKKSYVFFDHTQPDEFFDHNKFEPDETLDQNEPDIPLYHENPEDTFNFKKPNVSYANWKPNVSLGTGKPEGHFYPTKVDTYLDNKKPDPSFSSKKSGVKWVNLISTRVVQDNLRVSEVRSNLTTDGTLTILVSVESAPPRLTDSSVAGLLPPSAFINCYVIIAVKTKGYFIAQKDTPCRENLQITMDGFLSGPYEVCAKLSKNKDFKTIPICVVPQFVDPIISAGIKTGIKGLNTVLIGAVLITLAMIVALVLFVRRMMRKPTIYEPNEHYIYYRQSALAEEPKSYVMLSAAKA